MRLDDAAAFLYQKTIAAQIADAGGRLDSRLFPPVPDTATTGAACRLQHGSVYAAPRSEKHSEKILEQDNSC